MKCCHFHINVIRRKNKDSYRFLWVFFPHHHPQPSLVSIFSSYLSTVCSGGKCAAADGQQAVIWTCGLTLASGDQMSTVRDHSSHCVYLRDSPPLQPSIAPSLSLCLPERAPRLGLYLSSSSSMLTSLECLTFLTCLRSRDMFKHIQFKHDYKR